ncbi:TadE family protein [Microbacterium sp. NE2HP2]|uniref:TadE family protein n=1 Tax=Microbacterium plantarum TaxID=1816425 RepID=UPI0023670B58|nr:TadE family protein [Microbacterium plantarum]MDD7943533.1 TadE family protein [Microbacterium plantarum]
MRPPTTRSERRGDDDGSASLEFLTAGLILLVPVVYLIVSLGIVQSHTFAAQAAARHIARAVATATDVAQADTRAEAITRAIAAEYGMAADDLALAVSCDGAGPCPRPGEMFRVTAKTDAVLPLVPPVLGLDRLARVPIEATAVQRMPGLWGAP